MTDKSREQKLRRVAKRQGLCAQKGRDIAGFSGWMLIDYYYNAVVAGADPFAYSLSLEEAEAYVYG